MFPKGSFSLTQTNKRCQEETFGNPKVQPLGLKLLSMGNKGNFVEWLEEEMQKRNWRPAELAHAAGLYSATLSRILNGDRQPGPDVCLAIAKAFELPPESVFRMAGLLPMLPGPDRDPMLQEIYDLVRNMNAEERQEILEYTLFRYRRKKN